MITFYILMGGRKWKELFAVITHRTWLMLSFQDWERNMSILTLLSYLICIVDRAEKDKIKYLMNIGLMIKSSKLNHPCWFLLNPHKREASTTDSRKKFWHQFSGVVYSRRIERISLTSWICPSHLPAQRLASNVNENPTLKSHFRVCQLFTYELQKIQDFAEHRV